MGHSLATRRRAPVVGGGRPQREGARVFVLAIVLAAATAAIEALPLPSGFHLDPADRVRVGARGDMAALVRRSAGGAASIYVWNPAGTGHVLPAPPLARGDLSATLELGALGPGGEVYAAVIRYIEGARMEQTEDDVVYAGTGAKPFTTGCPGGSALPSFANNDGTLGITFLADPNDATPDNALDGSQAPDAALVRGKHCIALGHDYVTAARGEYIAGYRGYTSATSHILGPSNLNRDSQYYVALRWFDLKPQELGTGVALDVASDGTCVGADRLPEDHPHALVWNASGTATRLASGDAESVAYAIDDNGRSVGTLVDASTKARYAFVVAASHLRRLDDVVRDSHWRLTYAYAILPDGRIVGTGLHDGVPAVFVVRM